MDKHFRNTLFAFVCFTLAAPAMAMAGTGSVNIPGLGHSRVTSDQAIAFDQHGLVMTAQGHPAAHVTAGGDLHIGNRQVATTARQRDLLRRYYAQARSANKVVGALGQTAATYGESVAKDVTGIVLAALLGSDSARLGNQHELGKLAITASRLCGDLQQLLVTQKQVRASLTSLQSYAAFRGEVECNAGTASGHLVVQ
ncbi:MAG TPA: hypothetical protein VFW60_03335 [Rhodanobacteraceae bacterium]|nr:hypothetical protein [Rhodanobacteraceae bacterium]